MFPKERRHGLAKCDLLVPGGLALFERAAGEGAVGDPWEEGVEAGIVGESSLQDEGLLETSKGAVGLDDEEAVDEGREFVKPDEEEVEFGREDGLRASPSVMHEV